jgi:hypothetical protein
LSVMGNLLLDFVPMTPSRASSVAVSVWPVPA